MSGTVELVVGDNHTMQEFQKLLDARNKYLDETTEGSMAACALDLLRSIRVQTLVAKLSKVKVKVEKSATLKPSYTQDGSRKRPCLRIGKTRYQPKANERIIYDSMEKNAQVYRWVYDRGNGKQTVYLIATTSKQEATRRCKAIVEKKMSRFRGLARRAISMLMMKTYNKTVVDDVNMLTNSKADEMTQKTEQVADGRYQLTLEDNLDYALAALKGGQGAIDLAMQKSANKIASVINHKCKDLLDFKKLDTPFPELTRKRK